MKEFEDLLAQVAWIGIAVFVTLTLIRLGYAWFTRHRRGRFGAAPAGVRVLRVVVAGGVAVLASGLVGYLFVLQRGSAFMPYPLKLALVGVMLLYCLLEIALCMWPQLPVGKLARARGIVGAVFVWAVAVLLVRSYGLATAYPDVAAGPVLQVPFEGEWVAMGAGATAATNHHHRIPSQRYAIDIAKACDDGRLFRGDGVELEESCTFGALIVAPADGTVVHAVGDLPDRGSRDQLAGNHVIIDVGGGHFVALAHLQQHSVLVGVGDRVDAGQPVGRAGSSGNTDFPHLHVHVQDGPVYDLRESRSIPFRFEGAEVKRFVRWAAADAAALVSNDRVRAARD